MHVVPLACKVDDVTPSQTASVKLQTAKRGTAPVTAFVPFVQSLIMGWAHQNAITT